MDKKLGCSSDQIRLIVKETYGWESASPARPAIPPPTSSSVFQNVLHQHGTKHIRKWEREKIVIKTQLGQ